MNVLIGYIIIINELKRRQRVPHEDVYAFDFLSFAHSYTDHFESLFSTDF